MIVKMVAEELKLLDPDVIITANLWDGNINEEAKIIDVYHFSRPGKRYNYRARN